MKRIESVLLNILVDDIEVKDRARKDYKDVKALMESIRTKGLIQPIAVCQGDDGFSLLAGGRRLLAYKQLRLKRIEAKVFPRDLDEYERKAIELEENIQREDLSYSEEASLTAEIHELYKTIGMKREGKEHSIRDTAVVLGRGKSRVRDELELARYIKAIPGLAKLKNKSEALKFIKKAGSLAKLKKEVSVIKEARKSTTKSNQLTRLENSYIVKDFFDGVKGIEDRSIKLIDLDPDWAIDIKDSKQGLSAVDYTQTDIDKFREFFEGVASECVRVLQNDGWLIVWYGAEWYQFIVDTLTKLGLKVQPVPAIWVKDSKGSNRNPDLKLSRGYESFIYARKPQAKLSFTKLGRSTNFVYNQVSQGTRIHPAEKPVSLLKEIYETFAGRTGRVLHPFLGSGNGLLACSDLGLIGFGYDLSENNKNAYILRVNNGKPGTYEELVG